MTKSAQEIADLNQMVQLKDQELSDIHAELALKERLLRLLTVKDAQLIEIGAENTELKKTVERMSREAEERKQDYHDDASICETVEAPLVATEKSIEHSNLQKFLNES